MCVQIFSMSANKRKCRCGQTRQERAKQFDLGVIQGSKRRARNRV